MNNNVTFILAIAKMVWANQTTLGAVRDTFGSDFAEQVYLQSEHVTKTGWVRRVR